MDYLPIAQALGVVYQSDGHNDEAGSVDDCVAQVLWLKARIQELEDHVSPPNSCDLADYLGPVKLCPFCGSESLERDAWEENIICKNCGASCPVGGWQFRAV